ncbi:hypothetical protein BB561_000586 [Smittium simulii]|uniref:Uncharacterized protein n=1 Tax=Smittium simulii TaxID=133385 RepID=A0A2T9YYL7_9FUNG|nr:hypothetical protein BB561_000586 [Smittium simulii]
MINLNNSDKADIFRKKKVYSFGSNNIAKSVENNLVADKKDSTLVSKAIFKFKKVVLKKDNDGCNDKFEITIKNNNHKLHSKLHDESFLKEKATIELIRTPYKLLNKLNPDNDNDSDNGADINRTTQINRIPISKLQNFHNVTSTKKQKTLELPKNYKTLSRKKGYDEFNKVSGLIVKKNSKKSTNINSNPGIKKNVNDNNIKFTSKTELKPNLDYNMDSNISYKFNVSIIDINKNTDISKPLDLVSVRPFDNMDIFIDSILNDKTPQDLNLKTHTINLGLNNNKNKNIPDTAYNRNLGKSDKSCPRSLNKNTKLQMNSKTAANNTLESKFAKPKNKSQKKTVSAKVPPLAQNIATKPTHSAFANINSLKKKNLNLLKSAHVDQSQYDHKNKFKRALKNKNNYSTLNFSDRAKSIHVDTLNENMLEFFPYSKQNKSIYGFNDFSSMHNNDSYKDGFFEKTESLCTSPESNKSSIQPLISSIQSNDVAFNETGTSGDNDSFFDKELSFENSLKINSEINLEPYLYVHPKSNSSYCELLNLEPNKSDCLEGSNTNSCISDKLGIILRTQNNSNNKSYYSSISDYEYNGYDFEHYSNRTKNKNALEISSEYFTNSDLVVSSASQICKSIGSDTRNKSKNIAPDLSFFREMHIPNCSNSESSVFKSCLEYNNNIEEIILESKLKINTFELNKLDSSVLLDNDYIKADSKSDIHSGLDLFQENNFGVDVSSDILLESKSNFSKSSNMQITPDLDSSWYKDSKSQKSQSKLMFDSKCSFSNSSILIYTDAHSDSIDSASSLIITEKSDKQNEILQSGKEISWKKKAQNIEDTDEISQNKKDTNKTFKNNEIKSNKDTNKMSKNNEIKSNKDTNKMSKNNEIKSNKDTNKMSKNNEIKSNKDTNKMSKNNEIKSNKDTNKMSKNNEIKSNKDTNKMSKNNEIKCNETIVSTAEFEKKGSKSPKSDRNTECTSKHTETLNSPKIEENKSNGVEDRVDNNPTSERRYLNTSKTFKEKTFLNSRRPKSCFISINNSIDNNQIPTPIKMNYENTKNAENSEIIKSNKKKIVGGAFKYNNTNIVSDEEFEDNINLSTIQKMISNKAEPKSLSYNLQDLQNIQHNGIDRNFKVYSRSSVYPMSDQKCSIDSYGYTGQDISIRNEYNKNETSAMRPIFSDRSSKSDFLKKNDLRGTTSRLDKIDFLEKARSSQGTPISRSKSVIFQNDFYKQFPSSVFNNSTFNPIYSRPGPYYISSENKSTRFKTPSITYNTIPNPSQVMYNGSSLASDICYFNSPTINDVRQYPKNYKNPALAKKSQLLKDFEMRSFAKSNFGLNNSNSYNYEPAANKISRLVDLIPVGKKKLPSYANMYNTNMCSSQNSRHSRFSEHVTIPDSLINPLDTSFDYKSNINRCKSVAYAADFLRSQPPHFMPGSPVLRQQKSFYN